MYVYLIITCSHKKNYHTALEGNKSRYTWSTLTLTFKVKGLLKIVILRGVIMMLYDP